MITVSLSDVRSLENFIGVYIMRFPNGKAYVGASRKSVRVRLMHHLNASIAGRKDLVCRAAIIKYGSDNVLVQIIPCLDPLTEEKKIISRLLSEGLILYNKTKGGEGTIGFSHSEETKKKMSSSAKKTWTPERRASASKKFMEPDVRERRVIAQKASWTEDRRKKMACIVRNRSAKLSESDVLNIAKMLSEGFSCASIGRKFNITAEAVSAIKFGKNWSHITGASRERHL